MVELKDIMFDNVDSILNLTPDENQQLFVGPAAKAIAVAFAGINEGYPGFLQAIYYDGIPVGIIHIGRAPVEAQEPEILQKYKYVYRLMEFLIDKNYQHKGIGKAALRLALEKVKEYPDAGQSPLYLECHKENKVALDLYKLFGFQNTNIILSDDNYVLVKLPE